MTYGIYNVPYSGANYNAYTEGRNYSNQDLIELQRYLSHQQASGMGVPSFAAQPSQQVQPEKDGLGFVGWATIIGTAGAVAYGIKKGKFDKIINWVKDKVPSFFKKEPVEYSVKAPKTKITAETIDKSLPPRTTPLKGEARKQQQEIYDKLFGADKKNTAVARATKTPRKAVKSENTSLQDRIEASLPQRTTPLTGAAREAKEASLSKVFA